MSYLIATIEFSQTGTAFGRPFRFLPSYICHILPAKYPLTSMPMQISRSFGRVHAMTHLLIGRLKQTILTRNSLAYHLYLVSGPTGRSARAPRIDGLTRTATKGNACTW
jgi:hypothetical protein